MVGAKARNCMGTRTLLGGNTATLATHHELVAPTYAGKSNRRGLRRAAATLPPTCPNRPERSCDQGAATGLWDVAHPFQCACGAKPAVDHEFALEYGRKRRQNTDF